MSNSLHTVRVIATAYDQSNSPFDGYITAKLGTPIESTEIANQYVTQLQVQRASFVEGTGVLELIPNELLGDNSFYVIQIVRNSPRSTLLEAAVTIPDEEDCLLSDLLDLEEYNLSAGNMSTNGMCLSKSDRKKIESILNEVRLAKVAFNETSTALIEETETVRQELTSLQTTVTNHENILNQFVELKPTLLAALDTVSQHTSQISTLNSEIEALQTKYDFITNSKIDSLFDMTYSEPDYYSYYMFIVSGQSNASGSGNQGATRGRMQSSYGLLYDWNPNRNTYNTFIPLKDPCYPGSGDSAWPAFCDRFYALTGKIPIIVNIASGGAAVTTFAGTTTTNSWANDGVGTLRTSRGPIIVDAIKRLKIDSLQCKIAGILWCQGCAEGGRITNGYVTANDYKQATKDIWAWTRNVAGYSLPVFVSQIGWSSGCFTGANAANVYAGYQAVQNAQVELCNNELNVFMGFDQAKNFYDANNYRMDSGGIHYSQEGYTEMGIALAEKAVQVLGIELLPEITEQS